MQKTQKAKLNQIALISMLALGIILTIVSAFYSSSFLAILGVTIIFWGAIGLCITPPSKHVPLTLLNASTASLTTNIERILFESNLTEKGRYLPPKYLKNFESGIVFIPRQEGQSTPKPEEVTEDKLLLPDKEGLFLTPPGLALSKLFERELGSSFTKTNLDFVQRTLPKLLVEEMELVDAVEMQIQNGTITLELRGSILFEVCQETKKLKRTHEAVGCLLSSAVACMLAKATGKVIIIQKETQSPDGKITRIEYQIQGE